MRLDHDPSVAPLASSALELPAPSAPAPPPEPVLIRPRVDGSVAFLRGFADNPKPPQFGYLASKYGGENLELEVLRSAAGYYLGTQDENGAPYSRESQEYFRNASEAEEALASGRWTQKPRP